MAVPGFQPPLAAKGRTTARARINLSIAGFQLKFIKAPVRRNMSVTSAGAQPAIHRSNGLRSVAAAQVHLPLEVGNIDFAVTGVQVDFAFTRQMNVDVDTVIADIERHPVMGISHVDLDHVAVLVFLYLQPALADLVSRADHVSLNGFLVPSFNSDIDRKS